MGISACGNGLRHPLVDTRRARVVQHGLPPRQKTWGRTWGAMPLSRHSLKRAEARPRGGRLLGFGRQLPQPLARGPLGGGELAPWDPRSRLQSATESDYDRAKPRSPHTAHAWPFRSTVAPSDHCFSDCSFGGPEVPDDT